MLLLLKGKYSQLTAVITPQGYNASLDPEASFTFQCDVTGTNNIQWLIDGICSSRQENRNRGINEGNTVTVDEATAKFRRSLFIVRNIINMNTTITCVAIALLSTGSVSGITSEPVLFKVRGFLKAPSNLMLSEGNNQCLRRLSWDRPFSLDIIDVNPDISGVGSNKKCRGAYKLAR